MLKTSKQTNWNGQSTFNGELAATFSATVDATGKISYISMTPSNYQSYTTNIMEVMNDFQSFQQTIMKDIENDKQEVQE